MPFVRLFFVLNDFNDGYLFFFGNKLFSFMLKRFFPDCFCYFFVAYRRNMSCSCSSSTSSPSSPSHSSSTSSPSSSSDSSPTTTPVLRASVSPGLHLSLQLGKKSDRQPLEKENFENVILKVVPVKTSTRTSQSLRYWVAVAVGNRQDQIGIGEKYGATEKIAIRAAEKAAFRNIRRILLLEDRTVPKRVFGRSGGDLVSLSEAPKDVGVIGSGMTKALLNLAGIKDCFVTNSSDRITTVRCIKTALSKLKHL